MMLTVDGNLLTKKAKTNILDVLSRRRISSKSNMGCSKVPVFSEVHYYEHVFLFMHVINTKFITVYI